MKAALEEEGGRQSGKSKTSVKKGKPPKATVIQFSPIRDHADLARVQIVLCNISDRPLQFIMKCAMGSNVSVRDLH